MLAPLDFIADLTNIRSRRDRDLPDRAGDRAEARAARRALRFAPRCDR